MNAVIFQVMSYVPSLHNHLTPQFLIWTLKGHGVQHGLNRQRSDPFPCSTAWCISPKTNFAKGAFSNSGAAGRTYCMAIDTLEYIFSWDFIAYWTL